MEQRACVRTGDRLPRGHHLAFGNLIINEDRWTHQRNLLEVRRGNTFYDSDDKESVNQILALETSCLLTPRHTLVHEPKA